MISYQRCDDGPQTANRRLKLAARLARSGARIFKNAGFSETLRLGQVLAIAKTARDARRGIKGGAAIIHLHALTDPLRPALVDGEMRLNYGELEERVNRLTHGLRALGIGPGERIAAFLYNGHEYLELDRGAATPRRRQRADRLSPQGAARSPTSSRTRARARCCSTAISRPSSRRR